MSSRGTLVAEIAPLAKCVPSLPEDADEDDEATHAMPRSDLTAARCKSSTAGAGGSGTLERGAAGGAIGTTSRYDCACAVAAHNAPARNNITIGPSVERVMRFHESGGRATHAISVRCGTRVRHRTVRFGETWRRGTIIAHNALLARSFPVQGYAMRLYNLCLTVCITVRPGLSRAVT